MCRSRKQGAVAGLLWSVFIALPLLVGVEASGAPVDYARTVVVSPAASNDPADNGTALLAALTALAAAVPAPSADAPWLLKIEPGIYDLGTSPLQMLSHVDVEGSGETVTIIRGSINSVTHGVVNGASGTELRLLAIEHLGANTAIALHTQGSAMTITHVSARVNDGLVARAVYVQPPILIENDNAVTLTDVSASAAGTDAAGISACCSARMELVNVTAAGRTGLFVINRTVTARNSVITGTTRSVLVDLGTANLVTSQLDGPVNKGHGTVRCVGAYDGAFVSLTETCARPPGRRPF